MAQLVGLRTLGVWSEILAVVLQSLAGALFAAAVLYVFSHLMSPDAAYMFTAASVVAGFAVSPAFFGKRGCGCKGIREHLMHAGGFFAGMIVALAVLYALGIPQIARFALVIAILMLAVLAGMVSVAGATWRTEYAIRRRQ